MTFRSKIPATLALMTGLGACGSQEPTRDFAHDTLDLFAGLDFHVDRADRVGYRVDVTLFPGANSAACPPSTLKITVNDEPVVHQARNGCNAELSASVGPLTDDLPIVVRLQNGDAFAESVFRGVLPGTTARVIVPEDGRVPAGAEVVLSEPPALAGLIGGPAMFFWSDLPDVQYSSTVTTRAPDGIHVRTPGDRRGRARLFSGVGTGLVPVMVMSCTGLRACKGEAAATLGPIVLQIFDP